MRQRGGFITTTPLTFSTSSASGVFTINDAAILRAATQWPRGPLAPTSLTALAGSGQLSLSWTAPATTYGTITNYLVEYTPSGGSAVTVLTGSTGTSYTLTGLTNGTSYTVRVAAVNFTAGDYSGTVTMTAGFAPHAVVLTSGTSYSIPPGASSMKVWAIGGGGGGYAHCDGGSPAGGGRGAVAVRTYSVTGGGAVTYSVGGGGGSDCGSSNPGGSTSVSYGGVALAGGGGAVGANGVCTNATTCGLAGNNVDGLNEAVTLSGSSISGRGAGAAAGPAPTGFPINSGTAGAVVLYFA